MDVPFEMLAVTSVVASAVVSRSPLAFTSSYILTFIASAFVVFIAWAAWRVFYYPNFSSPFRHLPQPTGNSPYMGQFYRIIKEPTGAPMLDWINNIPNDGLIFYRGLFNTDRLFVTNPKVLNEVLTQKSYDFVKPSQVRTSIGRVLGFGLVLTEGEEHKVQRKNLMPAFAFRHVKDLYPVFWNKGIQMIDAMTSELSSKSPQLNGHAGSTSAKIEVSGWCSRATLDIIGVAGIGVDFDSLRNPNTPLIQTYRRIFEPSKAARFLGLLSLFFPAFIVQNLPVKRNGEIGAAVKVIRSTCMDAIKHKRGLSTEEKKTQTKDILSIAMASGAFSDENLVDQLMTFLAAGHETTATAMMWAVFLLCKNPAAQARLREEVRSRLPSPNNQDSVINDKVIDSLPYLNAVTQEVLRVYPPVALTPRTAACDETLAGQPVPKGTRVMIVPWAINRAKALWGEDAAEFKPERWLGEKRAGNGGAESNYAMMTFLHGPRSCIGQAFARAEFKCLLAIFVGKLEMSLEDPDFEPELKGGVTVKPEGGLEIVAKILDGW